VLGFSGVDIPKIVSSVPPELVVFDRPSRCPYLCDQVARMPMRLPTRPLSRSELDQRLSVGDRRQGVVLYRASCPACTQCEPLRLDVHHVNLTRSQRRVQRTTSRVCTVEYGRPLVDNRRLELYHRHKVERGLSEGQEPLDARGYSEYLVASCCDTFELRYLVEDRLAGVAIVDRGATALSAVYCYFDPSLSKLSLGTYSILTQIALCRAWGLRYLYLGLYIRDCSKMRYKARFMPHERLIDGRWRQQLPKEPPTAGDVPESDRHRVTAATLSGEPRPPRCATGPH
jgi:arginyl-tRNA--protein-N-Asp/Glu arginylyltransferase